MLDFGSGSGEYLKYAYDTESAHPITELVALEPNQNLHPMLERLIQQLENEQNAEVIKLYWLAA